MTKYIYSAKHMNRRAPMQLPRVSLRSKALRVAIGGVLACMVIGYVVQVNDVATKGYRLKELENSIADLRREREELQVEATRLQSMAAVKDRVGGLEMVSAKDAEYIAPTPVAVAR